MPVSQFKALIAGVAIGLLLTGCDAPPPPLPSLGEPETKEPDEGMIGVFVARRPGGGRVSPLREPLFPSLPSPEVEVSSLVVESPRIEAGEIRCDVTIEGRVLSDHCDLMPGDDAVVDQIRVFLNGGEKPLGTYPLRVVKAEAGSASRPFAFEGGFEVRLSGLPVTEGTNTLTVTARDPLYLLDGYTGWSFGIEGTYSQALGTYTAFSLSESPECYTDPSQGDLSPYAFFVRWPGELPDGLRLAVGKANPIELPLSKFDGTTAAVWEAGGQLATFTVRLSKEVAKRPPSQRSDRFLESEVRGRFGSPDNGEITDELDFYTGWGLGVGHEGYDLVFSPDRIVMGGASPSPRMRSLGTEIVVAIKDGDQVIHEQALDFPDGLTAASYSQMMAQETPRILWHLSELIRTGAPTSDEVGLALIMSDLSEVGLSEISLHDWRGDLMSSAAEILEHGAELVRAEPPVIRGYRLGRVFGESILAKTEPANPDEANDMLKSEFLTRLFQRPYFR